LGLGCNFDALVKIGIVEVGIVTVNEVAEE
jgi:hypothetical protein